MHMSNSSELCGVAHAMQDPSIQNKKYDKKLIFFAHIMLEVSLCKAWNLKEQQLLRDRDKKFRGYGGESSLQP